MSELFSLGARRLLSEMDAGRLGAEELLDAYLERIEQRNPDIGAFLHVDREGARRAAQLADRRRASGEPAGPLGGVPVALKDNLCTRGTPTTCSSRILENFVPPYDAHVVERLRLAGAVVIGKLDLDEFGMGSSGEHAALGTVRNPWALDRVPGGSSAGAAAALAAGMVPLALGSDTGGSIRQPAALCGVVGFKPTYGRVSRFGLVAFASSLEQVGPLARNVGDCAVLLRVIAGYDRRDAMSLPADVPAYDEGLDTAALDGLRIGLPAECWGAGCDPEVSRVAREAVARLAAAGAELVPVGLPQSLLGVSCYVVLAASEASSNLARFGGAHYAQRSEHATTLEEIYRFSRSEGFGPEVKRRILLGAFALSSAQHEAFYDRAQRVRRLIRDELVDALKQVDVLASPTSPTAAWPRGERLDDPWTMYRSDALTVGANLSGLPAISLPGGLTDEGLPVGLQLTGAPLADARVLRVAHACEQVLGTADQLAPPSPEPIG